MIKGEVTVIRRPADDVETWMNIQRRKSTVCVSLCEFCVCVCVWLWRIRSTRVRAASEHLRYDIVYMVGLQRSSFTTKTLREKNAETNMAL